eukprot:8619809-Alexandrium_andersonii.AAC.1
MQLLQYMSVGAALGRIEPYTRMLVESAQPRWSECASRATMADSPCGQGRTPSPWAPSEPPPSGLLAMGEDAFTHRLGRGVAKRFPKSPCQSALAN